MNNKLILPSKDNPVPPLYSLPTPHSVPEDWSFWKVPAATEYTGWRLYTDDYVSAPSCLDMRPPADQGLHYALSDMPQTTDMLQGRIVTYLRFPGPTNNIFFITLNIPSKGAHGQPVTIPYLDMEWQRYRVTWWFAYDEHNAPSTRIRVERWTVDEWVQLSQVDVPPFTTSPCYCSIGGLNTGAVQLQLWDNTQIYIPAS